ncbi:OCIA domain-containing protein 1 [Anthonomus grandis grandis]|uniref:OCIA domain-containing protein 1 n=1 Tax=Anthonomus grandis grandis TaxID=2921223 RepID=UPI0021664F22|nr:OCIA domain-containing protein 1 [Anthonomus grandis grandis]
MNPNLPGDEPERRTPFPGPNAPRRPEPYRFSSDEIRVLRECQRESFYNRSLPLATIFTGLTYFGMRQGAVAKASPMGVFTRLSFAALMGYYIGKFSYHRICAEKFMALPNSKIGRMLKSRHLGIPDEQEEQSVGNFSLSPFSSIPDTYSDIPDTDSTYDYNNRPTINGLDDSFRPSLDNPIVLHEEEMPPEQKHITTYEELRKQNRQEYEKQRMLNYKQSNPRSTYPLTKDIPPKSDLEFLDEYKPPPAGGQTKYGDSWG